MSSIASPVSKLTRILAPAKLNLHLELHRRRDDGFHDLETIMVAIDHCDEIELTLRDDQQTSFACDWLPNQGSWLRKCGAAASPASSQLPTRENNLAWKALTAFRDAFGFRNGVDVKIRKRIPLGAGLGGASADAAGILLAVAHLIGVSWANPMLRKLAETLGSDVPFLMAAGAGEMNACLATGKGERLSRLEVRNDLCFVLFYPPHPVSTRLVFERSIVPSKVVQTDMIVSMLTVGRCHSLKNTTHNRLTVPACELEPRIVRCLDMLRRAGVSCAEMTGSGSTCFAILPAMHQARRVAKRLQGQGIGLSFPCRMFLSSRNRDTAV